MTAPYIFAPSSAEVISTFEREDGERVFFANEDYIFYVRGYKLLLPKYRLSDGFSIPKVFRGVFSKSMYGLFAAMLHDLLYAEDCPYEIPRWEADLILRDLMKYYGHSFLTNSSVHSGLKVGGWSSWKKHPSTYYTTN